MVRQDFDFPFDGVFGGMKVDDGVHVIVAHLEIEPMRELCTCTMVKNEKKNTGKIAI